MPQEAAGSERQAGRRVAGAGTAAERGTVERSLAPAAIVIGLVALVLGFIPATHFLGALAGVIGLPLALYSQMVSASTGERWLNVIGMVGSFVGAAFALRHGGFTF
ncbi:hypothetical protein [Actinomadura macrotermitis]|uniref:FUSC family protein n=1 Tax=Actinomadura macrotermitis TaxID=2585200 RepID=A0A7K0BVZ0_9ACTN|nr:hypothetical protein [Actinomadura macrotermitis]MQY05338.1 hypothetical protein [Actinomadura macrotermitis]